MDAAVLEAVLSLARLVGVDLGRVFLRAQFRRQDGIPVEYSVVVLIEAFRQGR